MQPKLSLNYSSGAGNGLLGMGWSVSGLSTITRCSKSLSSEGTVDGVDYSDFTTDDEASRDRFCLDGQKLIALSGAYGADGTEYRTEHDIYAQVVSHGALATAHLGPDSFTVKTHDGKILAYSAVNSPRWTTTATQLAQMGTFPSRWLLASETDRSGNSVVYSYNIIDDKADGLEILPSRIDYTKHTSDSSSYRYVQFNYEDRADVDFAWQSGVRTSQSKRLKSITMYAPNPATTMAVWTYRFGYVNDPLKDPSIADPSLLASVQKCGIKEGNTETLGGCLWKKKFDWYTESPPQFTTKAVHKTDIYTGQSVTGTPPFYNTYPMVHTLDVDGDGSDDVLFQPGDHFGTMDGVHQRPNPQALLFRSRVIAPAPFGSPFNLLGYKNHVDGNGGTFTPDVDLANVYPLDIDGDGTSEVFLNHNTTDFDCQSKLVHWDTTSFVDVTSWPTFVCNHQKHRFLDFDGDGRLDHAQNNLDPAFDGYAWYQNEPYFGSFIVTMNAGGSFGPNITADVFLDGRRPSLIADFDGDGRGEVYGGSTFSNINSANPPPRNFAMLDTGSGWEAKEDAAGSMPDLAYANASSSPAPMIYGDFNGDGLSDAFYVVEHSVSTGPGHSCRWVIRWNTGNGFTPASVISGAFNAGCDNQTNFLNNRYQSYRVVDLNRDGRDDIVAFDASQGSPQVILMMSTHMAGQPPGYGFGFTVKPLSGHSPLWIEWLAGIGRDTFPASKLGDFNGDGFVDITGVEVPAPNSPLLQPTLVAMIQTPQFTNRLKDVSDEGTLWPRETITYSTELSDKPEDHETCAYPLHCVTRGAIVVREVTSRDHLVDPVDPNQSARTQYYSYEDPVSDMRGRGFQGFRKVRVWDPSRPMETVSTYANHTQWPSQSYPFALRPTEVTTVVPLTTLEGWPRERGSDAIIARVTRTAYTDEIKILNGGKTYDDLPSAWKSREWEQKVTIDWGTIDPAPTNPTSEHIFGVDEPSVSLRYVDGHVKYDDYGNLRERETNIHSPTDPGVSRLEVSYFDNLTSNWLLGLKRWDKVTVNEANNVDQPSITRAMDYDYDLTTGQLRTVYQEKNNNDPSLRATTTLTYDPVYGLTTRVSTQATDSAGALTARDVRMEYAPAWPNQPNERVFLSQLWRPFNPLIYRPSVWVAFHPAYGVVEATMDVNGVQTISGYDDLGRVVAASPTGKSPTQTSYAGRTDNFGGLNGTVINITVDSAKAILVRDALGREIKSSENKFDSTFADIDTAYDILGRVIMHSRPHASQAASTKTLFSYDPLDRLLKTTLPNSAAIVSVPSFSQTQTTDADHHQSIVARDVANRVISSSSVVNGTSISASYRYAPSGKIDLFTDALGNKTKAQYDVLDRLIRRQDPDAGTTGLVYDGFGEIITEVHQESGDVIRHQFDALGRIYDTADPNGGHSKLDWDTAVNGIGKVAGTHSPDSVDTANTYDVVGRPLATIQTVDGKSYKSEVHYDPQGRVSELLYPSIDGSNLPGLTLQYKYTSANYLYEIGFVAPEQNYQMLEHVSERNLDDALLKSEYGATLNATRSYDPITGRLNTEAVTLGANSSLFNLVYTYYPSGLVWTRTNTTVNRLETFTFDEADRLSDWKNQYAGSSISTHYGYDSTGNLTDVANDTGYTEHNDYGLSGNAYPHALTKQTFSGGLTTNYGYDAHGRQDSASGYNHDLNHGGPRNITKYTHFDLPHTLTMNGKVSTLLYNAFGDRVSKTTPDGTTTYMGRLYEFRQESGQPQHVFHVYGTDGALADITQATAASPKLVTYLANDALGSVGAMITPAGGVSQRAYFEPFGRRIKPDGAEFDVSTVGAAKNGFTGHEHDYEFGLINMRGRMYDPASRRFLTPDPIVGNPMYGQSWNPYSYVNNSPLNATDPTGYCVYVDQIGDVQFPAPPNCGETSDKGTNPFAGALLDGFTGLAVTPLTGGYVPGWGVPGAGNEPSAGSGPPRSDGTDYVPPTGVDTQPKGGDPQANASWKDSDVVQFLGGAFVGAGLGGLPFGAVVEYGGTATDVIPKGTRAARIGRGIGESFGGIIQIIGGAGGAFGGTVLSGTGLGILVGGPAIVGSGLLITSGAGNLTAGIAGLGAALMSKGYNDDGDRIGRGGRQPRETKAGANSADKRQIDAAAREAGITDRKGFGNYIEEVKGKSGRGGRDNFSWDDLLVLAQEFLDAGGK